MPFPLIVLGAGLVGFVGGRLREDLFLVIRGHGADPSPGASFATDGLAVATRPPLAQTLRTAAGVLGSLVTTWVTFAPCFLWIFLGAPYIEYLRGRKSLTSALSAITAAVVGVILNLAVWFALHTLFGEVDEVVWNGVRLFVPVWETVDPVAIAIAVLAAVALFRFKLGMIRTLGLSAAAGTLYYLTFLAGG